MLKIGVVGTKGGWSSEGLADAVAARTGFRLLVDMEEVRLDLPEGRMWFRGTDLSTLDGLIIKKIGARYSPDLLDRLETLRMLSARGVKIYSDPLRILRVLDRLSCTVTLSAAGIPMPPTSVTESVEQALAAVSMYGKTVFKPLYTSKARGMIMLSEGEDTRKVIEDYARDYSIMYIQKAIDLNGMDLGVTFMGGEYVTTYARCKQNGDAWNTTTASGGKYAPFDPPKEVIDLAYRAQALFGLEFTCVDVALTADGPFVFEVSAFGGFRGLLDARGIDAAGLYADHVIARVK